MVKLYALSELELTRIENGVRALYALSQKLEDEWLKQELRRIHKLIASALRQ